MIDVPGVDHILSVVPDLEAAAADFRRIGFTLTERGVHTGQGTHNRLAMLDGDYLELIAVEYPSEHNARWRHLLDSGYQGPAALALACNDDEAAVRDLARLGIGNGPSMRLARPVSLPEGARDARFGIVRIADGALPCASYFFCRHFTRDVVWRPHWQRHANGARRIKSVMAVHPSPESCIAPFKRIFGDNAVQAGNAGIAVTLGRTRLEIFGPEKLIAWSGGLVPAVPAAGRLIGYVLDVADLAMAERHFAGEEVPYERRDRQIMIGPAHACGAVLVLEC